MQQIPQFGRRWLYLVNTTDFYEPTDFLKVKSS